MTPQQPGINEFPPANPTGEAAATNAMLSNLDGEVARQNRELGTISSKFLRSVGALAVTGAAIGWGLGFVHNAGIKNELRPESSAVQAKTLLLEPVDFACTTHALADAAGSRAQFGLEVMDREIPGFGSSVVAKKELINLTYCIDQKGDMTAFKQSVEITQKPATPNSRYVPVEVKVPVEKLSVIVAPVMKPGEREIVVDHDAPLKLLLENPGLNGTGLELACTGALIFNGDRGKICDGIVKSFTVLDRAAIDANLSARGESLILDAIRKKCSPNYWPEIQKNTVAAYESQAIRLAGGDRAAGKAVTVVFTKDGNPTTEPPMFDETYMEDLKNKGVNTTHQEAILDEKITCSMPPQSAPTATTSGARL